MSPEYSLDGLMQKLNLQYFGHLMRRTDSLEKTLMLGKIGGRRRRGWQRMRWLDGSLTRWTCVWASSRSWWYTGNPGMLQSMGSQRVGHDGASELNLLHKKILHRKLIAFIKLYNKVNYNFIGLIVRTGYPWRIVYEFWNYSITWLILDKSLKN